MQEQMLRLTPNGCVDAVYGRVQNDECPDYSVLSNWVPASDTPHQWVPRPAAITLNNLITIPTYTVTVILASGTTWTVPLNWNSASNAVYCIGAGGKGGDGVNTVSGGAGGGAGACAWATNLTLTPGANINIQVGVASGTTGAGTTPTANTWFQDVSTVVAAGGSPGVTTVAGVGGTVGNSVGAGGKYAGGNGGTRSGAYAGGGGGAGGTTGAGANGANSAGSGY